MGELFSGSKTTTQNNTQTSKPIGWQEDQLKTLFGSAGDAFKAQSGTPWYQGDLYAGMSPEAKANLQAIGGFATGQGQRNVDAVTGAGQTLTGTAGSAIDAYRRAMEGYSADPTQANIAAAGAYAANPYLDGQIDAASRDVVRNLNEEQLPGIDRAAVASGNMNSSRAGVVEGIARRGAADRIADIGATMRGQVYDRGLGLAESARTSNLSGTMGAGSGFAGLTGQGLGALTAGNSMALTNLNSRTAADQAEQGDRQGELDAAYKAWQGQDTRQSDLLKRYQEIVGSNNWGGTTTGTTTQKTPGGGVLGGILGLASGAAGIATGLGWAPLAAKAAGALSK